MIPETVKIFLLENKEKEGYFCLHLNGDLKIKETYGKPQQLGLNQPKPHALVTDILPEILPETYDEEFEIPFFNINENSVCNIYFINKKGKRYLIFVDKSEIFQVTQKYQQFAHDDNISKNKFKRIAEELEIAKHGLKKSNQEKATLIAMLSHELGTPLTSILGYCELLLENDKNNKNLKIIHRNSIYLQHLIENTLLFGKSEVDTISTQKEVIAVCEFLNLLVDTILPVAQEKGILLTSHCPNDATINIDITRTRQILINLLNNAVKYTDSGSIKISFDFTNDEYEFLISDTGIGIVESQKQNIFNPWERVDKNDGKGSGIGLYISQKLAEAIGGTLKLKESSKNIGSVFQLSLPKENARLNNEEKQINHTHLKGETLLVIDDDEDILDLIEAFLEKMELNIICVQNFQDAHKVLNEKKVKLILTDLNVGSTQALKFLQELRDCQKIVPVVLMSAMPSHELKSKYIDSGFEEVMSKPFNYNKLCSIIVNNINNIHEK